MAKPTTKATFIEHCLRSLGAPVIEVNVDDDQLDDRVDEAIQFWEFFHDDASEKAFFSHTITAANVTDGYITIANTDLIKEVLQVLPPSTGSASSMFDITYQFFQNDLFNLNYRGAMLDYYLTMSWINMLGVTMGTGRRIAFEYIPHKNQLRLDVDWSLFPAGTNLVLECNRVLDPATVTDMWDDYFLKRYATALIKMQWGQNMSKFEGMQMPGGVTFNGLRYIDEAKEEIEKLTEEARLVWELPVDFYMG